MPDEARPPDEPRTREQRLEHIRILTEQLLRAREVSGEVKRLSTLLRDELEAVRAIDNKRSSSDE